MLCHKTRKLGVTGDETDDDDGGLKKLNPSSLLAHGVIPSLRLTWTVGTRYPGPDEADHETAMESWRFAMEHYVGLDVSLKQTAICIVDRTGAIKKEGTVPSDPEAIAAFINTHATNATRIGLESGAMSTWLLDRAQ